MAGASFSEGTHEQGYLHRSPLQTTLACCSEAAYVLECKQIISHHTPEIETGLHRFIPAEARQSRWSLVPLNNFSSWKSYCHKTRDYWIAMRKSHFGLGGFHVEEYKKYNKHNFCRITFDCILEVVKLLYFIYLTEQHWLIKLVFIHYHHWWWMRLQQLHILGVT